MRIDKAFNYEFKFYVNYEVEKALEKTSDSQVISSPGWRAMALFPSLPGTSYHLECSA